MKRLPAVCLFLAALALLAAACDESRPIQTPPGFLAPTVTEEPTVAMLPTAALEPTVVMEPTYAVEPTVAMQPTVVMEPTYAVEPTIETLPTAAMEPAGFHAPDPVEGLGDVQEALVGGQVFRLEVARTPQDRARGLMGRESLARDAAMIFVYADEAHRSFWMKNTLIPLDIIFIDSELTVVDVQTMRPEHETAPDLPVYTSDAPALYAVEVSEGRAAGCGIEPGDTVTLVNLMPGVSS